MSKTLEIVVQAEAMPGLISKAKLKRGEMAALGELLKQLAEDPTRKGVLLRLGDGGEVSLASRGIGDEVGRA